MTREDKELLIRDLCARLPYGVNVKVNPVPSKEYNHIFYNAKIVSIDIDYIRVLFDKGFVFQQDITEIKPYLFPLSSMTEGQKKEEYEICKYYLNGYETKLIDFYHKNHLDHRGLIPMGLALDATGLEIYP